MYQQTNDFAPSEINSTNMVTLPPRNQKTSLATAPAINNNNYQSNNINGKTINNVNIKNIIDSNSASSIHSNNINQISRENRNQNVNANANVEHYRPTYGAYLTNILPRGPYLRYKFNDQQQLHQQQEQNHHPQSHQSIKKSNINENDNKEHSSHSQHSNHLTNHEQLQTQPIPINHPEGHQLETASSSKDFRSLPYVVNANPIISNNPLTNYHQTYHNQCAPVTIPSANMASTTRCSGGNLTNNQTSMLGNGEAKTTHNPYSGGPNYNCHPGISNSAEQWNSISQSYQKGAVRSTSNPSLHNLNLAIAPGSAYATVSNDLNWHQINASSNGTKSNRLSDKMNPSKGYQTLPHKLRSGQGGAHMENGGHHYALHNPISVDIKSNQRNVSGHSITPAASTSNKDFLQQIKQKNCNMLARMSVTLSNNYSHALSQQENRYPRVGRATSEPGVLSTQFSRPPNLHAGQTNCVTLDDVIRLKVGGLSEYEGWAILCQAVQALQDLFLTDTPSTLRILPLVRPSTVQITSRGRVVFVVTTTLGQLDKFNDVDASSCHDITSHLAPEFLSANEKKMTFAESDIEKMWIYSLGITLRKTIRGHRNNEPALSLDNSPDVAINSEIMSIARCTQQNHGHRNSCENSKGNGMVNNNGSYPFNSYHCALDISLDQVLGCMCERNLYQRASLMYLLDLNLERGVLRRAPLPMDGLRPAVDKKTFNFTRVRPEEKLMEIRFRDLDVTVLINTSPITRFHCLLVPRLDEQLPQVLTRETIDFAVRLLWHLNSEVYKIAYNSPGAAASVNHLHLHLIHLDREIFGQRAVISTFCRNQQQVKPFSHIVMDLFAEVAAMTERDCDEKPTTILRDGSRSETDSGRSSAHGDKDSDSNGHYDCQNPPISTTDLNYDPNQQNTNLRVIRNRPTENVEYQKFGTIGYAGVKPLHMQKKDAVRAPALQVVRRNKEGILKRKNSFRRNTIDINLFDLEKARQENFQTEEKDDLNKSKSTNCIDMIDDGSSKGGMKKLEKGGGRRLEGLSMPDLNAHKMTTLPNSRSNNYRLKSFEALTKAYSESSFWIKPNGPEFIVKSSLPSREIELIDLKCQHRRVVSVLLLNGQSLHISCNSLSTTAKQIFEAVIKSENYVENFFIGLCALIGGDFVFLPNDLKIYKVAPQIWINVSKKTNGIDNVFFTLFLRIKFFLPTLRGISSLESRHMLYLQLRKSVLEKHILCTDDDLISLGGLALQAEVGDFKESMKYSDYFTISHYLPEGVYQRNKEMAKYLRNSHYCRQGLHPKEAEQNFIKYIQDMKEYGFHLYSAVWTTDDATSIDVYVGISLAGIALFERNRQPKANPSTNSKTSYQRKLYMSFEWLEIENLCFSKHILCIVVRRTESLKAKDNNRIKYKLKMDGRKSYFAFSLASEHHQFYMKLRNSFISLKTLSDKLNIPVASTGVSTKTPMTILATSMERQFNGIEINRTANPNENHTEISAELHDVGVNGNNENCQTDCNRANIANGKVGIGGSIGTGIQENIKKIDKQLKASGLRVRNLKKSMLNDNRLIKLKQRFLRRSKSTVGSCQSTENSHENDDNRIISKRTDRGNNNSSGIDNNDGSICGASKEENQNKENECPKVQYQLNDLEPKIYSPNRNRVKMGTRVFSTQFLNKSYDNIYDRTLNLYRFESTNSINNDMVENNLEIVNFKVGDDGLSVRSVSLNSLYSSEKKMNRLADSPPATDAFVIHSSIKSDHDPSKLYNNFSLPNETISESLMEKFNNISSNNTFMDRIITKVTVVKERLHKNQNQQTTRQYSNHNVAHPNNSRDDLIYNERRTSTNATNPTKYDPNGYESIKYATFNQKMAKEYSDCVNNRNRETYNIKGNSDYTKALWHLSRSQESIFINNKFPVRNGCVAVNQKSTNRHSLYNAEIIPTGAPAACTVYGEQGEFTLGISIVQGSDNNVYVKDLVKNGPAEKSGVRIGDQIIAVNGISLLNLSYAESLRLLQNTGLIVELQVSQIFNKDINSSEPTPTRTSPLAISSQTDNKNLFISRRSMPSATTKLNYANSERRNLNGIVTNHCDEYLKRLEVQQEETTAKRSGKHNVADDPLFLDDTRKRMMKVCRENMSHDVEGIGKRSMKRIGSFEIAGDNIRPTRDKFKSSRNVNGNLCCPTLSPAKSMPDLPKVVAIIPKPDQPADDNTNNTKKGRISRTGSQSRKYLGPVRYPVTPIKTILSPIRNQLSLLADSDDEQVFI